MLTHTYTHTSIYTHTRHDSTLLYRYLMEPAGGTDLRVVTITCNVTNTWTEVIFS